MVPAEQRDAGHHRGRPAGRCVRAGGKVLRTDPAQTAPEIATRSGAAGDAQSTRGDHGDPPIAVLLVAYQMPGDLDPAAPAPNLLPSIINNQRSPFFKALIESGLTESYGAFADTQLRGGLLYVQLVVAPNVTPQRAIEAFDSTVRQVERDGVAPDL